MEIAWTNSHAQKYMNMSKKPKYFITSSVFMVVIFGKGLMGRIKMLAVEISKEDE